MVDIQLQNYIEQMHGAGFTDSHIKRALHEAGWARDQILHVFGDAVIHIDNLKKYFGDVKAIDDISFMVEKGEIFGFLGPNGAGKTTTIRCIMDFLRSDNGSIRIAGKDSRQDSILLKDKIGYLPGAVKLYDQWTGYEHINFARCFTKRKDNADQLAERLNLDLNKKTKNLSSGNRQKLGLVFALMFDPEILILDEPTLALDPLLQNQVYALLQEASQRGATVFMSSHNLPEVERVCDRVAIIKKGKIVAVDEIKSLQRKHMYSVKVFFEGEKPTQHELEKAGALEIRSMDNGYIIKIKGDVNVFIDVISRYKVHDLNISLASLEEIFLEFYQE